MAFHLNIAVAAGLLRALPRRGPNERRQAFVSTEDIQIAIRLSQAEVQVLAHEFNQWRSQHGTVRVDMNSSEKRVVEFLTYLARGGYYHQVALARGIAKCTFMFHVKEVAHFFASIAHQYIQLPETISLCPVAVVSK
jgi:hypothetical protein